MASKFKRQLRRKRWSDSGTLFPLLYSEEIEELHNVNANEMSSMEQFLVELKQLTACHSTYNEIAHLKRVSAALASLWKEALGNAGQDSVQKRLQKALELFLEIIFLENSRPLHRGLLATFSKFPREEMDRVNKALQVSYVAYGVEGAKHRLFATAVAGSSVLATYFQALFDDAACMGARLLAQSCAADVAAVVNLLEGGGRINPSVMEDCQEALGTIYNLLQRFPLEFQTVRNVNRSQLHCSELGSEKEFREASSLQLGKQEEQSAAGRDLSGGGVCETWKPVEEADRPERGTKAQQEVGGMAVYAEVVDSLLEVLIKGVLSRECIVGASVALCAALHMGSNSSAVACQLARAFFSASQDSSGREFAVLLPSGTILTYPPSGKWGSFDTALMERKGESLASVANTFEDFSKLCWFRGLLTTLPRETLNYNLLQLAPGGEASASSQPPKSDTRWRRWTLLYDGILPALCSFCEASSDGHFKFHAITSTQICLQQVKASIQGGATKAQAVACDAAAARCGLSLLAHEGLPPGSVERVLQMVWHNWEDPLTQTVRQVQVVFDLLLDLIQGVRGQPPAVAGVPDILDSESALPAPDLNQEGFGQQEKLVGLDEGRSVTGGELVTSGTQAAAEHFAAESGMDAHGLSSNSGGQVAGFKPMQLTACEGGIGREEGQDVIYAGSGLSPDRDMSAFLKRIAGDLLAAGGHRRGRYVPLASLSRRIGAMRVLDMSPGLLFQTLEAFADVDVCYPASSFLRSFLEGLRVDCWHAEGGNVAAGDARWRCLWMPPILTGLLSGDHKLRANMTTYALTVALQLDSDSVWPLLESILGSAPETAAGSATADCRVGALVSILKVARLLAIVSGGVDQLFMRPSWGSRQLANAEQNAVQGVQQVLSSRGALQVRAKGGSVGATAAAEEQEHQDKWRGLRVPVEMLEAAICHADDGLRVDAAELLCLNPRTTAMPSPLEVRLLQLALPLSMRCASASFRMRWTSLMKKLFTRIRCAVERCLREGHAQLPVPRSSDDVSGEVSVEEIRLFMRWLARLLLLSLYPGAPYERKNMAMELFHALLEIWPPMDALTAFKKTQGSTGSIPGGGGGNAEVVEVVPYEEEMFTGEATLMIVASIVDSWDRLREGAFSILLQLPSPLPGMDSPATLEGLLQWAKGLVGSPRVRESDAGALILRLIVRKYVCCLAWKVEMHPQPKVTIPAAARGVEGDVVALRAAATSQFVESLNDWLQAGVEEGEADLVGACRHSLVHGVLLAFRYAMEEVEWQSPPLRVGAACMRIALRRLLSLVLRVTKLALWVVSADALKVQHHQEEEETQNLPDTLDLPGWSAQESLPLDNPEANWGRVQGDDGDEGSEELAPLEQMVMVGCWLSMKEVSLLLGTLAHNVPLSGSVRSNDGVTGGKDPLLPVCNDSDTPLALLDGDQLQEIGEHFVSVLLAMKHNGAIEKTRAGFVALCDRLLRSRSVELNRLPETWLHRLMARTAAQGQTVDDLLRRSAGIPAAFLSLFLGEPSGTPKKLLPVAMRWLLQIASWKGEAHRLTGADAGEESPLPEEGGQMNTGSTDAVTADWAQSLEETALPGMRHVALPGGGALLETPGRKVKARAEGLVPTVHAFNVLRVAFHDTNLATDTSGFCAEGIQVAVRAFASKHWEVRNAACLAFTALVHRCVGFLNTLQRETARRAISAFEFFHRYPSLHPFLLDELESATLQLLGAKQPDRDGTPPGLGPGRLHPSLCPILVLLSRLKPSVISSKQRDWLSPAAFVCHVSLCATQRDMRVRKLASRALPPLVPASRVPAVLLALTRSLPVSPSPAAVRAPDTRRGADSGAREDNQDQPHLGGPELPSALAEALREHIGSLSEKGSIPSAPGPDQSTTRGAAPGAKISPLPQVSYNAVHGTLLQLQTLLAASSAALAEPGVLGVTLNQLFPDLEARSWLGSPQTCRCYLAVKEYLRVLETFLETICSAEVDGEAEGRETSSPLKSLEGKSRRLLLRLARDCLGMELERAWGIWDPTAVALREFAVGLYFKVSLAARPGDVLSRQGEGWGGFFKARENFVAEVEVPPDASSFIKNPAVVPGGSQNLLLTAQLAAALQDEMYEVRLATLKALKKRVPGGGALFDVCNLRSLLVQRLQVEKHALCVRRMLQVLFAWSILPGNEGQALDWNATRFGMAPTYGKLGVNGICYPEAGGQMPAGEGGPGGRPGFEMTQTATAGAACKNLTGGSIWGSETSALQLWYAVLAILADTKHVKTREVALRCLGACLAHIIVAFKAKVNGTGSCTMNPDCRVEEENGVPEPPGPRGDLPAGGNPDGGSEVTVSRQWQEFQLVIAKWQELVVEHSRAEQPVTSRHAISEAIIVSGILAEVPWAAQLISSSGTAATVRGSSGMDLAVKESGAVQVRSADVAVDTVCLASAHAGSAQSLGPEIQHAATGLSSIPDVLEFKGVEAGGASWQEEGSGARTKQLWFTRAVLQTWIVCVKLLEDEDAPLRCNLAEAMQHVIAADEVQKAQRLRQEAGAVVSGRVKGDGYQLSSSEQAEYGGVSHGSVSGPGLEGKREVIPAQVEMVIELSFQHLTATFAHWDEYFETLLSWMSGAGKSSSGGTGKDADLVRRLFDKEIDNHHEEELFFVQLCCLHAGQIVAARSQLASSRSFMEMVHRWQVRKATELLACARKVAKSQSQLLWAGGMTNHGDAFLALLRCLLGLLALAGQPPVCASTPALISPLEAKLERVPEPIRENLSTSRTIYSCPIIPAMGVGEALHEAQILLGSVPLNPVVASSLLAVLEAYERGLGVPLGAAEFRQDLGQAVLPRFEPVFLLL